MKISKPLITFTEYQDFNEIKEYFSKIGIDQLSQEELALFRDYYYLINTGGHCTGAMTESSLEDLFGYIQIDETFAQDIVSGNATALDKAGGVVSSVGTILGAAGLAAGGYLYWKMKTKKAGKLVDAENDVKIKIAQARVKAHKEKESIREKYKRESENKSGKELEKARKTKNNLLSKQTQELKKKEELYNKHLEKLKDITDTYIKMKGGGDSEEDTNESVAINELVSFSGSDWIANWIRKRRLQGDIEAKQIELAILPPSQKEITDKTIKDWESKVKDLDKKEKEEQSKGEKSMSEEDKKKEKEVSAKIDAIDDKGVVADTPKEETEEKEEKSTGAVDKVKNYVTQIKQLQNDISKMVQKESKVQDILSGAKERGNKELESKSSELLMKYRQEIKNAQKEMSRIKKDKINPIRDKATGLEKSEISDLLKTIE